MTARARAVVAPLTAALVALVVSLLFIRTGAWSVYDEYTHFDYVVKVAEDHSLPPVHDALGQTTLQTAVCDQAPGFGRLNAACGADYIEPTLTPYGGQSTATSYLPTYYVVTGVGVAVLHALPLGIDWLTSARMMGALYLAIAALLIVGIARRLGASSLVAWAVAVGASCAPLVLHQFSTVNNDGFAVMLSLAAVYAFLRLKDRPPVARSLTAFGLAFLAMTAKETAFVAVLAITLLSLRDVLVDDRRHWARGIARVLVSAAVVVIGVVVLRSAVYPALVGSVPDNGMQEEAIVAAQGTPPINLVAGNALRAVPAAFDAPDGVLAGVWFGVAALILMLLALGVPLAGLLRIDRRSRWMKDRALLGASVLVGIPLFVVTFLALLRVQGLPPFFQARYLMPLLVLGLAVAGAWVRRPWGWLLAPAAGVLAVTTAVALITAPHWTG
ncbi:MAG: DUF2142 domain-containing protein [Actinomycetales bacterium]|nr:DUF2142 domain-containing protein [Actinomycetales bacterium]